jgi:hypothetical protein
LIGSIIDVIVLYRDVADIQRSSCYLFGGRPPPSVLHVDPEKFWRLVYGPSHPTVLVIPKKRRFSN